MAGGARREDDAEKGLACVAGERGQELCLAGAVLARLAAYGQHGPQADAICSRVDDGARAFWEGRVCGVVCVCVKGVCVKGV